ncbi:MAG TPA: hypothetical protein VFH94_09765 [Streptomyces sp.]|nr:hypothetical protein [Streptomyces sp.]
MADNYSAEIQRILASSNAISNAVGYTERLVPNFERDNAEFEGCWGIVGSGDPFADTVTEQVREEQEQVIATVNSITTGFMALIGAVADEAANVQKPQDLAMEDIQSQSAESESKR